MKFCQAHWDKLRAALEDRGLGKYISKNSEQALEGLAAGKSDPLLAAHNAIVGIALETVGMSLLVLNDDGSDRCPICYTKQFALESSSCDCGDPACTPAARADGIEHWIDFAANAQLERFAGGQTA